MKVLNHLKKYIFIYFIVGFLVLNILTTYFLTLSTLNKYIVTFEHTFLSHVSSFFGNLSFLIILLLLMIIILKKPKKIAISLTVITSILNIMIFAMQYFSRNYKVAFSFFNFSMIKNPTGGFGSSVVFDFFYELFVYYRIICLLPMILFIFAIIFFRNDFEDIKIEINFKKIIIGFLAPIFTIVCTYQFYQLSLDHIWKYGMDYAQYGCQYAGVYPYYLCEMLGIDNRKIDESSDPEQEYVDLNLYNKNSEYYVNYIDNSIYSNKDNQTGILNGKNIYVIQMESMMTFLFNNKFNNIEVTPYLNQLIKEDNCFLFTDVYTSVGIGNTSDAEFSFFTGYYPTGSMTLAWEFAEYDFDIKNLGDYLNDYRKFSYNGTNEAFYYHKNLHEELYKLDLFRGLETFEKDFPRDKNPEKYTNYWIRDEYNLKWARDTQINENKNGNKVFSFVETITPHTPFEDLSDTFEDFTIHNFEIPIQYYQLTNYLNQVIYNDKMIYDFIKESTDPSSPYYLENTVFILYGDHGNAVTKGAYEALYDQEFENLDYRKLLLNIPVIFYDPSGAIKNSVNPNTIDHILSQTKSNTDIYRTLINLLGVPCQSNYYGVNMFSGEPSYAYDPKNLDIITDDFMYNLKNGEYITYNENQINISLINKIADFHVSSNEYINSLVYTSPSKKVIK